MDKDQPAQLAHLHDWQRGMDDVLFSCEECVVIVNRRARDRLDALEALARDVVALPLHPVADDCDECPSCDARFESGRDTEREVHAANCLRVKARRALVNEGE